jgi:hypothetical protein
MLMPALLATSNCASFQDVIDVFMVFIVDQDKLELQEVFDFLRFPTSTLRSGQDPPGISACRLAGD